MVLEVFDVFVVCCFVLVVLEVFDVFVLCCCFLFFFSCCATKGLILN